MYTCRCIYIYVRVAGLRRSFTAHLTSTADVSDGVHQRAVDRLYPLSDQ